MSKTLAFAILFMIKYPEVQKKVRSEIDDFCQNELELVTLESKSSLPYTEATMLEIQRLASVLPISPPRLAKQDIDIGNNFVIK